MLVALDVENRRRMAWLTEKGEAPFHCPECDGGVLLKKGRIKEHHFAHIPPSSCAYGEGESQAHYALKREYYQLFSQYPGCERCELERTLKGVRPDVSLRIHGYPVAIEIQRSTIDIDYIVRKTERYAKLGIYVLYVVPDDSPKMVWREAEWKHACKPRQWEKALHSLFFGRVYYKSTGLMVSPYHFGEFQSYVEDRDWYDEYGDYQSAGGYSKRMKLLKTPVRPPKLYFHLVDDFHPVTRKPYWMQEWMIPACKLWMDNAGRWW